MNRVLYAPRNISGQASEYAKAVRPLGFHAEVWSYGEPAFGFGADRVFDPERLLTDPRYRWHVFDTAVRSFDIFHFQYGRSLLNPQDVTVPDLWDLPLLKSLGKRVFMHFRGSDVRLRSVHLAREPHSYFRYADVPCDEEHIRGRISICRRFCDQMFVSTPGLLDYVPDATWIPHVLESARYRRALPPEPPVPVLLHIPSSRATKSSEVVDAVGQRLETEGVVVYRPLQGLDRDQLLAALHGGDLLVDSLTIGDHGLLSVEAMAAGVIAVAHVHDRNRERNPGVPVVEATVDTVGDVLRGLAGDPGRRARLRREGAAWVARRHDPRTIGALLAEAYRTPGARPLLPVPDWPRADSRRHVAQLEAEVERLRVEVDPVVSGFPSLRTSIPTFVTDRLLARIEELEQGLRRLDPDSPLLRGSGRRRIRPPSRALSDVVRDHPALHRAARSALKRVRAVRR